MGRKKYIAGLLRIFAGGYLVYLGIKLIYDGLFAGSLIGAARLVCILASIWFLVFGGSFTIRAIKWMMQNSKSGEEVQEITEKEILAVTKKKRSLFDRAGVAVSYKED